LPFSNFKREGYRSNRPGAYRRPNKTQERFLLVAAMASRDTLPPRLIGLLPAGVKLKKKARFPFSWTLADANRRSMIIKLIQMLI
jgi:hypothetical protein